MNTASRIVCSFALMLISRLASGEEVGGIVVIQNPVKITEENGEHPRPSGKNKGKYIKSTRIKLDAQNQAYCIVYSRYSNPDEKGELIIDDHCGIGLWEPTICNWSCYDFFKIIINGKPITLENEPIWKTRKDTNGNGIVTFTWDTNEAKAEVIFSMKPEDDKLFLECLITPKININSIQVLLRNYPSFYAKKGQAGKRWALTNTKGEEDSGDKKKTFSLNLPQDYWIFFADKVFDVETDTRAKGPSGVMFYPEEVTGVQIGLDNYMANTATITYPSDTRKFHLIFWEFPGTNNKTALTYLKAQADKCRNLNSLKTKPQGE
ncbi:MAG: hypothetical protein A2017_15055 [Lentisphaerae bacterium GWF2_44_16]|nr:MAG: hypothetical protein A2017_15055 [Lentisphaerae bacterium GWF2_44_16]